MCIVWTPQNDALEWDYKFQSWGFLYLSLWNSLTFLYHFWIDLLQWHGDVFIGTTTHPAVTTSIISFLGSGIPTQTFICDCYSGVDRKYSFSRLKTWYNSPMDPMGLTWLFFPLEKNSHTSEEFNLYTLRKGLWALQGTLMYPHPFEIRVNKGYSTTGIPQKSRPVQKTYHVTRKFQLINGSTFGSLKKLQLSSDQNSPRLVGLYRGLYYPPWEPKTFIFRGYDPYIEGLKPSFFMVLGSKGSYIRVIICQSKDSH